MWIGWNQLYGLRNYLKSSLWVVPFFAIPFALIAARTLHRLDAWLRWSLLEFDLDASKTLLDTFVSATYRYEARDASARRLPADSNAALFRLICRSR